MSDYTFKDKNGQEWDLEIDYAIARRVDTADFSALTDIEVSMLEPSPECVGWWMKSIGAIVAMSWAICAEQAADLNITEQDWEANLDGESLQKLQEAFWRACSDFFPNHRTAFRAYCETLKTKNAEQRRAMDKAAEMIEEGRKKMEEESKEAVDNAGTAL